ncbi:MAG: molybdopterin cofactor-binding domain-containing protein [Planctomycetota bacterium]
MSREQKISWSPSLSRRSFLAGLAAGSLVLVGRSNQLKALEEKTNSPDSLEADLFVSIAPDGVVSILAHRSEMGTGIRTALPMVVADELGADWDRVVIRQALGDARLGSQNTDGSRSIRRFFERMRVAGATARTLLERAAAKQWGVQTAECRGGGHVVTGPGDKKLAYGDLVAAAKKLPIPKKDELVYRDPSTRTIIGRNIPIADLDDIVTGRGEFGIDARRENQVFAVIERSPVLGAPVKSVDDAKARALPGVVDVIQIPGFRGPHGFQALGGVAVIANDTWSAIQGRRALSIEWGESPHAKFNSAAYKEALKKETHKAGKVWRNEGDTAAALDAADKGSTFEADYYVPHLAHAPMEPPCAVAEVRKDASGKVSEVEVWAATQNPQAAQSQLAGTFRIKKEQIKVHVTLIGGGFGRKSKPDFIVEAAVLAEKVGKPVHVTWTREDDIRHDYFHSVAAVHVKAAVDDKGMAKAWLQRSAYPPIMSTFVPGAKDGTAMEQGLGATDLPYAIPNLRIESGSASHHVRIGWLRSVAHVFHGFVACSVPDELAHKAGRDPFQYLMELCGSPRKITLPKGTQYPNHGEPLERYPIDVGRLRKVTERVAQIAGWGKKLPKGRAQGIACHRSFLSYCANVVEVEVLKDGRLSIPKVHVVIDAGTVIHPDRVRAQMEGAAVFGASLALSGEITATDGVIDQSNFHDYPVARLFQAPKEIIVEIIESEELPAGVGEVGVPPFAPALCNAIYAAIGKRIRELPLSKHDLSWS